MDKPNYMGIDQFGTTYHNLGEHPRKELMARLGRKKAGKMYVDRKDGSTVHIGYVVGPYWVELYRVLPVRNPA